MLITLIDNFYRFDAGFDPYFRVPLQVWMS